MHKFTETTLRSVAWLKRENDEQRLQISPPYQRMPVWTDKQKGALIETILLEYPIPEIYMQDVTGPEGSEEHIVVDGQQRIRAVLEFIEGSFSIDEAGSRWEGLSFSDLPSTDRQKIFEYKFVVRILPQISDEQIRSIFQRINRNTVTLNSQELRHATYWGAFIKLMEELSDLEFWTSANIFSANDRRRMLDTEFVSELSVAYLNGVQNKKSKLEDFYQIYENSFDHSEKVRSVFFKVLGEIEQVLPRLPSTRFRKKSDFYTLFLVLASVQAALPLDVERRQKLGMLLMAFATDVDDYLAGQARAFDSTVADYARSVERAASDLGSRRARSRALAQTLAEVLPELHQPVTEMLAEPPEDLRVGSPDQSMLDIPLNEVNTQ